MMPISLIRPNLLFFLRSRKSKYRPKNFSNPQKTQNILFPSLVLVKKRSPRKGKQPAPTLSKFKIRKPPTAPPIPKATRRMAGSPHRTAVISRRSSGIPMCRPTRCPSPHRHYKSPPCISPPLPQSTRALTPDRSPSPTLPRVSPIRSSFPSR